MVRVFLCGVAKVSTGLDDVMQFMPDAVAHETGQQKTKMTTLLSCQWRRKLPGLATYLATEKWH
jgi:hypothetical protein